MQPSTSIPMPRKSCGVRKSHATGGSWYWFASRQHLAKCLRKDQELHLIARPGFGIASRWLFWRKHNAQQKAVIEGAFGPMGQDTPAK